jgi:hypothetical protein
MKNYIDSVLRNMDKRYSQKTTQFFCIRSSSVNG